MTRALFRRVATLAAAIPLGLGAIGQPAAAGDSLARGAFLQTNLVSDLSTMGAPLIDPNLKNPWGMASTPTGPIRVSDNNAGVSTQYSISNGAAQSVAPVIEIPRPGNRPGGAPTGTVFNGANASPAPKSAHPLPTRSPFPT